MPSAYEGTDIISYLHRKYIIRQRRISYRVSDISLKSVGSSGIIIKKVVLSMISYHDITKLFSFDLEG